MSIRVLVVDDQTLVRTGFRLILGAEDDIEVISEATDGESAVRLARSLRPDVVLMDIRMPGMDGIEATRQLAGPSVPDPLRVVVVTTYETWTRTSTRPCTPGRADSCSRAAGPGRWSRPCAPQPTVRRWSPRRSPPGCWSTSPGAGGAPPPRCR